MPPPKNDYFEVCFPKEQVEKVKAELEKDGAYRYSNEKKFELQIVEDLSHLTEEDREAIQKA